MDDDLLTTKEFRLAFQRIIGSTKKQIDIRLAHFVLNCLGKTITTDDIMKSWPNHTSKGLDTKTYSNPMVIAEKIPVGRLYDIYMKLDKNGIVITNTEQIAKHRITTEEVLARFNDQNPIMNEMMITDGLYEFNDPDGYVDIVHLVETLDKVQNRIWRKMSQSQAHVEEHDDGDEGEDDTVDQKERVEPTQDTPETPIAHRPTMPLAIQMKGYTSISPSLQCISYIISVDKPTTCELVIEMNRNTDQPPGNFENDIFLVCYDQNQEIIGLTGYWIGTAQHSSGPIEVTDGAEMIVIGMGTSYSSKKATSNFQELIGPGNKITSRFRMTLMNLFEAFDLDEDGVLNRQEMNFYTMASGDLPLTDESWQLLLDNFDNRDNGITMSGFVHIHQTEANDTNGTAREDMLKSLNTLGYDRQLMSIFGCAYTVSVYSNDQVELIPQFKQIVKEDRDLTLKSLYSLGVEHSYCSLKPRVFQTEYFGLAIAHRSEESGDQRCRLITTNTKNIRWNFPHRENNEDIVINIADSDSEWVLMASYTANERDHSVTIEFQEV